MSDDNNEMISHAEIPVDGSVLVQDGLTAYGKRVLRDHFPQPTDGLKSLYRRILWVARRFPDTGQGSESAIGQVKEFHDHSPESIYTTMARLAQPFQFSPPMITFHGAKGEYVTDKPAASRYTSISLHPFARDVFFKGIETDAIPLIQGMDLQIWEPKYLAPAIPMALVISNTTVGYGYGSKIPARNLGSICDLVEVYCNHLDNGGTHLNFDITKHAEKLLPDFPLKNIITNRDELLAEYRNGNFDAKIDLEGVVELSKSAIRIYTLPVGRSFNVVDIVRKAIDDAKSKKAKNHSQFIEQNVIDAREEPTFATILLKKNSTTVFQVWEHIRRMIGHSDAFHPNPNYVDSEGYIYQLNPAAILEIWYKKRQELILSSKRRQLRRLYEHLRIIEALLTIVEHTDKVIKIIRQNSTPDAIAELVKAFGLTYFQAEHLTKAQLSTLSKTSKADLEKQYADQKEKVAALQESFNHIPKEIAQMAQDIKRRYAQGRISVMPEYIGYVSVQGGCIQFDSTREVEDILENFPGVPLSVHTYDGPHVIQIDQDQQRWQVGSVSKYSTGDLYGLPFHGSSGYTVNIHKGTGCCVRGVIPGLRSEGYCYTTKRSWALHRSGKIRNIDITQEISMRKTISKGSKSDIIHVYPHLKKAHYLLIACNGDPNNIILKKIDGEDTSVKLPPVGDIHAIHHYTGRDWYFTLPEDFLNRVNARVFHITDAEKLLDGEAMVHIDLGQNKWKRHAAMKFLS